MKTIALIATLTLPALFAGLEPVENQKFAPEKQAEIAAMLAAD